MPQPDDDTAVKEWMKKRCKEYRSIEKHPMWSLDWACKQNDMCACLEIDRRDRLALPGTTRYEKAVGKKKPKPLPSGREIHRLEISKEYQKLKGMPPAKLRELVKEWAKEKKAHPKLSNAVVLQIAKDHVAYKRRKATRKRWKRR